MDWARWMKRVIEERDYELAGMAYRLNQGRERRVGFVNRKS